MDLGPQGHTDLWIIGKGFRRNTGTRNINTSKYLYELCEQTGGQVGAKSDWGPPSLVGAHCGLKVGDGGGY